MGGRFSFDDENELNREVFVLKASLELPVWTCLEFDIHELHCGYTLSFFKLNEKLII